MSRLAQRRWFVPLVLACPYVVTIAVLRGLTVTLPIFHGSDEQVYHLPTIHRFASQLPFPDLVHYQAAQTPLFHLLMAYGGDVIGYQLWRLRLVEVLISYALAGAVFVLLHRRLGLGRLSALALTLLFLLSPYVFGASFRVVTDNLALLFVVLALERLERFRQSRSLGPYALACLSIGLGILTRQSSAFMLAVAGAYALLAGLGPRRTVFTLAMVGAAAVPTGILFLLWHGLVPRGGNGSSCGLCSSGSGANAAHGLVSAQTVELTLAALAVYGIVMFAPQAARALWDRWRPERWTRRWVEIGLAAALWGFVMLVLWPAVPGPGSHSAGLIWNLARRLPTIDASSLLFWILVPLAGVVLVARLARPPRRWALAVFFGFFLVQALATRLPWQKYVDPFALLALLLSIRRQDFSRGWQLAGVGLLAAASVVYAAAVAVTGGT